MEFEEIREIVIHDFKNYKKWKARLRAIQSELDYNRINTSKVEQDVIRSGLTSDPTYNAVQKMESLKREYAYIAFCMNRVEACLDAMTVSQRELISMRYFEGHFSKQVMTALGIEKTEYYKRLEAIILLCAEVCGYIPQKGHFADNMRTL